MFGFIRACLLFGNSILNPTIWEFNRKTNGKEMERSTERPSLLILNEYCLLEIFKFLQLDDSMNLAECCNRLRRVADRAVKIKSKFELDMDIFRKGDKYINRVFTHIGHHVSWLTIDLHGTNPRIIPNLSNIISDCNNLKSLEISDWRRDECQVDSTLHNFDKIELLSLRCCNLETLTIFLKNFFKLKYLTTNFCWHLDEELMAALLNNNPELESLYCFNWAPDQNFRIFQLLERIPKVKTLGLNISRTLNTTAFKSLLTLNGLTKLHLYSECNSINNVLSELAKKGIMEEMELHDIEIDDNFFDILKSFVRLQLLVIYADQYADSIVKVKSSTMWPTNLKLLGLGIIEFTHLSFISTIQQLKSLEYLDIHQCTIAKSDVGDFKNMGKLSQNILNVMDCGNRKQRLEVVLPRYLFGEDNSKTHLLFDSKPLRILDTNEYNALAI